MEQEELASCGGVGPPAPIARVTWGACQPWCRCAALRRWERAWCYAIAPSSSTCGRRQDGCRSWAWLQTRRCRVYASCYNIRCQQRSPWGCRGSCHAASAWRGTANSLLVVCACGSYSRGACGSHFAGSRVRPGHILVAFNKGGRRARSDAFAFRTIAAMASGGIATHQRRGLPCCSIEQQGKPGGQQHMQLCWWHVDRVFELLATDDGEQFEQPVFVQWRLWRPCCMWWSPFGSWASV